MDILYYSMYSKNDKKNYLSTIPISELEEYGYIFIREQPCKITQYQKFVNEEKHSGKAKPQKHDGDEDEYEDERRMRFDIVAENVFSGKEVFKGIVKGPNVEVPVLKKMVFGVVFIDNNSERTQLLDEDFQENEDIPLPLEDNPELCEQIRNRFNKGEDLNVRILEIMGKTAIVGIENQNDK